MNRTIRDILAKTGASIVAFVAAFSRVLNIFNYYYYNNGADVCLEKPLNLAKLNKELARLLS